MNIPRRLAITGVLGLVALDAVLVGLVLGPNHLTDNNTSPAGSRSSFIGTTGVSASPLVPSSTTPTVPGNTAPAAPLQTMLVAIDHQRAWRISAGSCSAGGATLATTADGGRTWADTKTPLRRIVRVRPTNGQTAFVVGSDLSCVAKVQSTADGGHTWASTGDVGAAWFRDPKDHSAIGSPGQPTSKPCGQHAVLDLAVVPPASARVLCADGLVRSTTNTGSSWSNSGTVAGAVALAVLSVNPGETFVARLDAPECAGVQVRRVDQNVATSCIVTAVPKDPGQIALSLVKGGGWLAVGDRTMRSTDKLVTWRAS